MKSNNLYQIGQLAQKANISVQSIRYYEKRKLLHPKHRRESKFRLYDDESLKTIRFIKNAQELGFNLDEIAELLSLREYNQQACENAHNLGQKKLDSIRIRIQDLGKVEKKLFALLTECQINTSPCIFLHGLEEQES